MPKFSIQNFMYASRSLFMLSSVKSSFDMYNKFLSRVYGPFLNQHLTEHIETMHEIGFQNIIWIDLAIPMTERIKHTHLFIPPSLRGRPI